MRLILQHGWGFNAACWQGWLSRSSSPCLGTDRGYWGRPLPPAGMAIGPSDTLVCHSLGLHLLARELVAQAGCLVIISGFAHFHGHSPEDGRFTRRHIQRMQARLQSDPVGLIRDFYRDCACPDWPVAADNMDTALLGRDLALLDQSRLARDDCHGLPPTLLLHGRDDRIVPLARAEALAEFFSLNQLIVVDDAGHGLPFTHPGRCLELIRDFRESQCANLKAGE